MFEEMDNLEIGDTFVGGVKAEGRSIISPSYRTKTENGCSMQMRGTLCEVSEFITDPEGVAEMIAVAINKHQGYPRIEKAVKT